MEPAPQLGPQSSDGIRHPHRASTRRLREAVRANRAPCQGLRQELDCCAACLGSRQRHGSGLVGWRYGVFTYACWRVVGRRDACTFALRFLLWEDGQHIACKPRPGIDLGGYYQQNLYLHNPNIRKKSHDDQTSNPTLPLGALQPARPPNPYYRTKPNAVIRHAQPDRPRTSPPHSLPLLRPMSCPAYPHKDRHVAFPIGVHCRIP